MLLRNVGLRGRNKLANRWEDDVDVVKDQPERETPVFVLQQEGGHTREHVATSKPPSNTCEGEGIGAKNAIKSSRG